MFSSFLFILVTDLYFDTFFFLVFLYAVSLFCYCSCVWCGFSVFFFSSRRRHTRCLSDWSSDVCSSDLSTAGGTAVGNVLANDRFNGAQATTENVVLSAVSTTNDGVTLDPADGSVDVAAGTVGGTHTLVYRICEPASPTNCDQATVTVTVVPQTILASPSKLTVYEGGSGSFTVRLSQQPSADVVISVAFFEGTATVTPSPSAITLGPANWSTGEVVTFQASSDADKDNNAATINLSS